MAIKDLLVAYTDNPGSRTALAFALQMARKYDAGVTGFHVVKLDTYEGHIRRWIPDDIIARMHEAEQDADKAIETVFREQIAEDGFEGPRDWISENGQPSVVLAREARYHDLLVIGQFTHAFRREGRTVQPEEILHRSGKPMLVVPESYERRPFKEHAAVAWDGSRSAARALSDAMQILETKERLDVITVETDGAAPESPVASAGKVVAHLERHGIDARHVALEATRTTVGQTVLGYCDREQPDVLVMGAFGRATLGGLLFGGVTRHVLEHMQVPLLMSH